MATWAEQHEAIQTALEKLKSKKAEVKPIGPDLKNYKKPAGPAVDRCAKDKQWPACQEGRHQYNGKNFCGRCGEPRPKQVPVGDRRSRLHAALDAVMTYSKPPVIRKTLSILNPNDLAKMTGSSEPQYIGKGKPYTGFAKDSQHWMPETGNHALADKLHAQLTGEGFSPAFGSGNKAGDITYRYEKGKERAYLLARRNGQHTIERKAAGAYGKGLAKDAKPWPIGAKVVVLAGKHTGERGTVEHSDSKITTVKFSDCKSDPVWTDSLSIYGG
jgi:hypothetical protein